MPMLLFAYGTLAPRGPEEAARGGWIADAVRGTLYDLGPYPALVSCGEPGTGWVEGFTRPIDHDELINRLDPYEGVADGLYRRVGVTTRLGKQAWVYVYARPLPPNARGPLARWAGWETGVPPEPSLIAEKGSNDDNIADPGRDPRSQP